MTRRTLLSAFAALFAMTLVMLCTGTSSAQAQQNLNCCTYTIDVAGIPASCFRIPVWTRWSTGVFGPDVIAANGMFIFPTPTPPPCPPAANFIGASLAGPGGPFATFNHPVQFQVNGCCMVVRIGFDSPSGCVRIHIRPC